MAAKSELRIRGARHHNLKNIDVDIPKNRLVVISGLSGSGKSTLAFDTIYAEGQRRYVESLSAYARQFLEIMDKPDVDSIEGLSPAISIQQKTTNKNPRSTVGTITEIYDYMRLLYARIGTPFCTRCHREISTQSAEVICDSVLRDFAGERIMVLAPVVRRKKGLHEKVMERIREDGYTRVRLDGDVVTLGGGGDGDGGRGGQLPALDKNRWHSIEIVVDRIAAEGSQRSRLFEAVQAAIRASKGDALVVSDKREAVFSQNNACPRCGLTVGELEPRNFSFNSPMGMCQSCSGLGTSVEFDPDLVVPDRTKTMLEGGIAPLGRLRPADYPELRGIGKRLGFDLMTPMDRISPEHMEIILYGHDGPFEVTGGGGGGRSGTAGRGRGRQQQYTAVYEGVIPGLQRLYDMTGPDGNEWMRGFMREVPCGACGGRKLRPESLAVRIGKKGIMDVCDMSIEHCYDFFSALDLTDAQAHIARDVLKEIRERLEFLMNVGLGYLNLDRRSATLSGGEAQRIRLATQIGSNLTGVLYVLDEPTIGLHQRDNERLIRTLSKLRDIGNTVIIVEHDREVIQSSDWIVDLGPGAGANGGSVVFEGTVGRMLRDRGSVTGRYLRDGSLIGLADKTRRQHGWLTVRGASENNLKGIDVGIPLGLLVSVTGVSGSGKSTLINEILLKRLMGHFYGSNARPGRCAGIDGIGNVERVIAIDQSPIGRTPRSNPATYIGALTPIRELYSRTQLSRERGYTPGQFSFNVAKGRCFACAGDGVKRIEMQFLADVYVKCDQCHGRRYNSETLSVLYKGKSIADVLAMTVEEALGFFEYEPVVRRKLKTLHDVGLGYIRLGQSSTTLSGGEAQRVKLSSELSKRIMGNTLYILDEPTTGLHFADVQKLLEVLNKLVNKGNTVVVIEHNMDVIRNSDWIIDLGPEGGDEGGSVIAEGAPADVAGAPGSYTGRYLREWFGRDGPHS